MRRIEDEFLQLSPLEHRKGIDLLQNSWIREEEYVRLNSLSRLQWPPLWRGRCASIYLAGK